MVGIKEANLTKQGKNKKYKITSATGTMLSFCMRLEAVHDPAWLECIYL